MPKKRQTKKVKKAIRPLGDILLEIEPLVLELVDGHDLQWGDLFGLLRQYLEIHVPGAQEEYMDGSKPEFYYGPRK